MKRWIGIAMMVLVLAGCGGGDGEPLEPPEFDLTGRWVATEVDCTSFSTHLPQGALAELDGQLEYEILQDPGVRVRQTGNDLEITYLDDGTQVDGTISGDQIRYTVSEQQTLAGFAIDVYLEAEGTALDADTIAGTENLELTLEAEGEAVTISTVCTGRLMRVVEG